MQRIIAPLAVYAVDKLLDLPRVREAVERLEDQAEVRTGRAKRELRRRGKHARRNPLWLAAGAALTIAGIAMMVHAARR